MTETPDSSEISTKLKRIAGVAAAYPGAALKTLAHNIDIGWLKEAFRRTRRDGAVGVDGQTAEEYEKNLDENLEILLDKAKGGEYRAPPVRRVEIPKGDKGKTRPIGIPTFEDKVLQRALAMLLEPIYEQEFLDCSYGFRPRRSAHQALETFWQKAMDMRGGWIVELDIEKFFDEIGHAKLMEVVRQRVCDGVVLRLIGKWLNAGVMEDGRIFYPGEGTPQGGVISPLLANIFLHEVLDTWFERDVKPRMSGPSFMVRYADDAVLMFSKEEDARRVLEVLPKRFEKFGLRLHPEKTRLVEFGPDSRRRPTSNEQKTFVFLGFLHYWDTSPKGKKYVRRRTASDRFRRSVRKMKAWFRKNRHRPMKEQHKGIVSRLRGHYGYFGIIGNIKKLGSFYWETVGLWRRWLSRRSQRALVTWERMKEILTMYPLPLARLGNGSRSEATY